MKRGFLKIYHQHGPQVDDENHNIIFFFGENLNFIQIGNSYIEFEILVKKADRTIFTDTEEIRLVSIALAYVFQDARIYLL